MTDRYENIRRALAMGPTHGPWRATKPEPHGTAVRGPAQVSLAWCGGATTVGEEGCYSIGAAEASANAHFIAACDPDTIRALLDERDALAAEIERLRAERDALAQENELLRKDAERYRCLSAMATQQADDLGPIFRIDVRRSEPHLFNFDAAVDAAMREEGSND